MDAGSMAAETAAVNAVPPLPRWMLGTKANACTVEGSVTCGSLRWCTITPERVVPEPIESHRSHQRTRKRVRAMARPSYVRDTYGAKYDFAVNDAVDPRLEYMLAAVPRSGSTHLAMEMWRTGVMGAPMEYANPLFRNTMSPRFGRSEDLLAYWHEVKRHRSSPNGMFGFKAFVMDYINGASKNPEFLALIAPAKVILLTRDDLVEQAVSYSKAIRSGTWFHGIHVKSHPAYDAKHIQQCVVTLRFQIDFWHDLFALTGTMVHHVKYEELLIDSRSIIRGIAEFLGVELDSNVCVELPHMRIQRDAESAEWVNRFKNLDSGVFDADSNVPFSSPAVSIDDLRSGDSSSVAAAAAA